MKCKEICERIEARYPVAYACEWDNPGLLVGSYEKEVDRIYLGLDATEAVIDAAVAARADLLITHHPMIFSPLRKVNTEDFIGRRIIRMIQTDLSYYAMHTNYDVCGMAELAAAYLKLTGCRVLEPVVCGINRASGESQGFGRIGALPRIMTVRECCAYVKDAFRLPNVRVFGDLNREVACAAVAPGSGKSMIKAALNEQVEVLITGDIDHHEGIDAVSQGMTVIDAGHYGIEHIFIEDMERFLREQIPAVEIIKAPVCQPFEVV